MPSGSGPFVFWPCDGGLDELPGVFGGRVNSPIRASNDRMRISCAAILSLASANAANNAAISVSFSAWLKVLRSGGGVTRRLESTRA